MKPLILISLVLMGARWMTVREDTEPMLSSDGGDVAGWARKGARFEVDECDAEGRAGALEGGTRIRCASLEAAEDAAPRESELPVLWASLRRSTIVFVGPASDAGRLARLAAPRTLAFKNTGNDSGWLERTVGGFVEETSVRALSASDFHGVVVDALPVAFTIRATTLTPAEPNSQPIQVPRFEAFAAVQISRSAVITARGSLPRAAVRIAAQVSRPAQIPPDSRWLHISIKEQTLTAFEGGTPVFATLVSTGRAASHATRKGIFRVWLKSYSDRMHGAGYFVEDVPFIQYFDRGQAIHGTFWHDDFGSRASHGCVNVSMADARWLFEWAPPVVPPQWHAVRVIDQATSLWVWVDN